MCPFILCIPHGSLALAFGAELNFFVSLSYGRQSSESLSAQGSKGQLWFIYRRFFQQSWTLLDLQEMGYEGEELQSLIWEDYGFC